MSDPSATAEISFVAGEADRRVAGVAAAARVVRDSAERGARRVVLAVPGARLADSTLEDIRRLAAGVRVDIVDRPGPAAIDAPRLDARAILRATAKPGDGPVSRHFNRPVSRAISSLLLRWSGIRPVHATVGTALLALLMFGALVAGGPAGLIAGAILFHIASVFDGVDGEIARATFRTSRTGARLDSAVDSATNLLFVLGVTVNLAPHSALAGPLGAWGLMLFLLGLGSIGRAAARTDRPFSLESLKQRYRARFLSSALDRIIAFLTVVSSRDFFAFLFALLILAGRPMAVLVIFAAAATVWIPFVIGALLVPVRGSPAEGSA